MTIGDRLKLNEVVILTIIFQAVKNFLLKNVTFLGPYKGTSEALLKLKMDQKLSSKCKRSVVSLLNFIFADTTETSQIKIKSATRNVSKKFL